MFSNFVFEKSSAKFHNKILIIDDFGLEIKTKFSTLFKDKGFEVIRYTDDITFRLEYENKVKHKDGKLLLISNENKYIPFDIRKEFFLFELSQANLFPKLNFQIIKNASSLDLDLISNAYTKVYDDLNTMEETLLFLEKDAHSKENIKQYLNEKYNELKSMLDKKANYLTWLNIADLKSEIDVLAIKYEIGFDTSEINSIFKDYILKNFGKLSQILDKDTPVLVSKVMEYITEHSKRFVIIVMDGMSEFDWKIISREFNDIVYSKTSIFAMIPTTTSVSRQCLLSNKYPSQLINPWTQSKEKQEFFSCANNFGFNNNRIAYERGYSANFNISIDYSTIIINDIDDLVHSQQQGKIGMYRDIELLSKEKKLKQTVKRFLKNGYDIYLTADHGNTQAIGMGKLVKTGVEVETKSKKMLVLKDIADKNSLIIKYKMIDYPKYYLDKKYDYLICDTNTSLDTYGSSVITHGGITIEEVVVPFIKIKSEENNG